MSNRSVYENHQLNRILKRIGPSINCLPETQDIAFPVISTFGHSSFILAFLGGMGRAANFRDSGSPFQWRQRHQINPEVRRVIVRKPGDEDSSSFKREGSSEVTELQRSF
jgi:hypothetical protein